MFYGNCEPGHIAFVRRVLQPGQVFVDAGAMVGYYSAVAASKVGPGGEVHSFEPVPWLYARLEQLSAKARELRFRIHANESALGNEDGESTIYIMKTEVTGWSTTSYDMIGNPDAIDEALPCRSIRLDGYFQCLNRGDLVPIKVPVSRNLESLIRFDLDTIVFMPSGPRHS